MKRILIPDDLGPSRAAVVRSLAKKGYICDHAWHFRGLRKRFKSRYIRNLQQVSPIDNKEDFVTDVIHLLKEKDYDILLPYGTPQLVLFSSHLNELSTLCDILIPSDECLKVGNDKLQLAQFCEKENIDAPRTLILKNLNDLDRIKQELNFPLVLKPRTNHGFSKGLHFIAHPENAIPAINEPYIAQEFIPGYIHDVALIAKNGEVFQYFTQIRKLMYPISGGVGALNFSTHNPVITKIAKEIIQKLNWSGMALLEFKLDSRDGKYKLIEINPRFYGTVDLAIKAGIDFPDLYVQLASGKTPKKHKNYQTGIRYKFLFGRYTLAMIQKLANSGWKDLKDSQEYKKRITGFAWEDPLPDIYSMLLDFRKIFWKRSLKLHSELPKSMINKLNIRLQNTYHENEVLNSS